MENNPLLNSPATPFDTLPFTQITPAHFLPALEARIKDADAIFSDLCASKEAPSFANSCELLEETLAGVEQVSLVFQNLLSAETSDRLQAVAKEFVPLATRFSNDVYLNAGLFARIKSVYDQRSSIPLTPEQYTLLEEQALTFIRNGALLPSEKQAQLRAIDERLSTLGLEYSDNLLAETNEYAHHTTNSADVIGLPEASIAAAAATAKEKGLNKGWVFTLHQPSFVPVLEYAQNRKLRETLWRAYQARCFGASKHSNEAHVLEIARLRHERALLLGFTSHADFTLKRRMAESPEKVLAFLNQLLTHAKPAAIKETEELKNVALQDGITEFKRWDAGFYYNRIKKQRYSIDTETLRPYFPLDRVLQGVFDTASLLYGIKFNPAPNIPVYHPDVRPFEVLDEDGAHLAILYTDFHPRKGKRGGAWMTCYRNQCGKVRPHISIVMNFTPPSLNKPSLLSFDEVRTLFHEFGHALHGIFSNVTYSSLASPNTFWDFVELPSQIMENWIFEKDCLDLFASHFQTGEKIPLELVKKITEAARFYEGCTTLRQLSFGLLDMAWHSKDPSGIKNIAEFEQAAIKETEIHPFEAGTNSSCAFGHIFSGGYSAGYYSYKWAEVLEADAFELFVKKGIFNREVASKFRNEILSHGGAEHPMKLYLRFRGREPSIEPLLEKAGLKAKAL
ncbi:M3 family metallopeptidase [Bdellovibrionota bacterium FG-2]